MKIKQMNKNSYNLFGSMALLVILMLALAACSPAASASQTEAPPGTTEEPGMPPTGEEATINVGTDPTLGEILVDGNGMTLYMFANDEPNTVNCTEGCLENWPPLVTQGSPVLGEGVDPTLVGNAPLPDGRMIVTYNSMPLYYYSGDAAPGDVNGQGVGDVWWVVSPEGNPVNMP